MEHEFLKWRPLPLFRKEVDAFEVSTKKGENEFSMNFNDLRPTYDEVQRMIEVAILMFEELLLECRGEVIAESKVVSLLETAIGEATK